MSTFTYKPAKSEKDHNLLYNVISMEITDSLFSSDKTETLPGYFKSTIDGMVRNFSGKLLSETIIEINGFPGREIKIDFQNGKYMVKVRFYMVKNKSYMIEKLTDTKKDLNKPIDRFMDSFKLI